MDVIIWLFILMAIVGMYFIPTFIAFARETTNRWSVFVVNTFLGWSFLGWIVALAMAVANASARKSVA